MTALRRNVALASAVSLLALSVLACRSRGIRPTVIVGSGNVVERTREVSGFSKVALSGTGELCVEIGDQESLRIEAEDNLMPYIETEVRDGRLHIGAREGTHLEPMHPVRFFLTVKELDGVAVSGSGDVDAPELKADHLSVNVSGSGDVAIPAAAGSRCRRSATRGFERSARRWPRAALPGPPSGCRGDHRPIHLGDRADTDGG